VRSFIPFRAADLERRDIFNGQPLPTVRSDRDGLATCSHCWSELERGPSGATIDPPLAYGGNDVERSPAPRPSGGIRIGRVVLVRDRLEDLVVD